MSGESALDGSRTHGRRSSKASQSIQSWVEAPGDLTLPIGQVGSPTNTWPLHQEVHRYTPLPSMSALSVGKVIFWSPPALSFACFFVLGRNRLGRRKLVTPVGSILLKMGHMKLDFQNDSS